MALDSEKANFHKNSHLKCKLENSLKKSFKKISSFPNVFLETYFRSVKVSARKQKKWFYTLATVTDAPKKIILTSDFYEISQCRKMKNSLSHTQKKYFVKSVNAVLSLVKCCSHEIFVKNQRKKGFFFQMKSVSRNFSLIEPKLLHKNSQ